MPKPQPQSRTPKQVIEQQKKDAAHQLEAFAAGKPVPGNGGAVVPAKPQLPALPDDRTPQQRYIDEVAPATFPGKLVKFSKEGEFVISESEEPIDPDRDFVCLADETLIGWLKFRGEGAPPTRVQGILYDGFVMPPRESLGDLDPAEWEPGLSGEPQDPWLHQQCLVLQDRESLELFTFATTSKTGRRAVGNLLRYYDRLRRTHADFYPVVRCKSGGFQHKDARVGHVAVPLFAVVGRAPKASATVPDTRTETDFDDQVPF